ncbi:hypothetical protein GQ600_472 [Phytophthora cactorum]|nr:hypothetical protein GQ600_472 [Phytophthora cactorum]
MLKTCCSVGKTCQTNRIPYPNRKPALNFCHSIFSVGALNRSVLTPFIIRLSAATSSVSPLTVFRPKSSKRRYSKLSSDTTVVLDYAAGDGETEGSSEVVEPTQQELVVDDESLTEVSTIEVVPSDDSDSEDSLDFGSDTEGTVDGWFSAAPKATYRSISFYNTLSEAEQALHGFNRFVYTYRTRYMSSFVLRKVYQCRSHFGCVHTLKLATHRVDETSFRYQLLHVPTARKMENRQAYLKKKATGGWEINRFAALKNWIALKICQDRRALMKTTQPI